MSEHVWYVSYGSNMDRRRLGLYLHGGSVELGSTTMTGTAPPFDSPPPTDDRWVTYPGRLYFDGRAGSWGGGAVAFLDVTDTARSFHGRAWRIARAQLAWIAARENASTAWAAVADLDLGRSHTVDDWRWYGGIESLGRIDGEPAVTVTRPPDSPPLSASAQPRPLDYLLTMAGALTAHLGPEGATRALSDPWPYPRGVERDAAAERRVTTEIGLVRVHLRAGPL